MHRARRFRFAGADEDDPRGRGSLWAASRDGAEYVATGIEGRKAEGDILEAGVSPDGFTQEKAWPIQRAIENEDSSLSPAERIRRAAEREAKRTGKPWVEFVENERIWVAVYMGDTPLSDAEV